MNDISGSSCMHCCHVAKMVESMNRDGLTINAHWCEAKHRWTDGTPGTCDDQIKHNPANGMSLPAKLRPLRTANRSIPSHQSTTT